MRVFLSTQCYFFSLLTISFCFLLKPFSSRGAQNPADAARYAGAGCGDFLLPFSLSFLRPYTGASRLGASFGHPVALGCWPGYFWFSRGLWRSRRFPLIPKAILLLVLMHTPVPVGIVWQCYSGDGSLFSFFFLYLDAGRRAALLLLLFFFLVGPLLQISAKTEGGLYLVFLFQLSAGSSC